MLKKTIAYVDYNGTERKEDFYFNLTKAELLEMELSTNGGIEKMFNDIVAAKNPEQLVKLFKNLILRSYGVKSEDGRYFVKNDAVREAFTQTEAYSELFMELATDTDKAIAFFNGVMPADNAQTVAPATASLSAI